MLPLRSLNGLLLPPKGRLQASRQLRQLVSRWFRLTGDCALLCTHHSVGLVRDIQHGMVLENNAYTDRYRAVK